jgi:hypothetical protein
MIEAVLSLGQRILVWSSLPDPDNCLLKLERTTVEDVIESADGTRVRLGIPYRGGSWGHCPTRRISDVIWDRESFDDYEDRHGGLVIGGHDAPFFCAFPEPWPRVVKLRMEREERSLKHGLIRLYRGVGGGHFAPAAKHVRDGFVLQNYPINKWDPNELPLRDNLGEAVEDHWNNIKSYLEGSK